MSSLRVDLYKVTDNEVSIGINLKIDDKSSTKELVSEEYKIFDNTARIRFRFSWSSNRMKIFAQIKTCDGIPSLYSLVGVDIIPTDWDMWQLIVNSRLILSYYQEFLFRRCATIPFKELYDDTDFTDFKLFGENNDEEAVSVHRSVLAVSSPVLKSMLLGEWKEAKQGHVQLAGVSKATLQHFKDYIYLKNLPQIPLDFAKLVTLATYFMVTDLPALLEDGAKIVMKNFRAEHTWDWFDYCVQQKNADCLLLLLRYTTQNTINDLLKYFKDTTGAIIKMEITNTFMSNYKDLYEDSNFMDFELRVEADDGVVDLHRYVIAASSPVLKKLLLGEWKEAKHGYVQVPGVSKATLQHFKDYIYLKKLPEDSMDYTKLLPLAVYYMMPELERYSAMKIANSLEPENAWQLFEYCVQNKNNCLLVTILKNFIDQDKLQALEEYFAKPVGDNSLKEP